MAQQWDRFIASQKDYAGDRAGRWVNVAFSLRAPKRGSSERSTLLALRSLARDGVRLGLAIRTYHTSKDRLGASLCFVLKKSRRADPETITAFDKLLGRPAAPLRLTNSVAWFYNVGRELPAYGGPHGLCLFERFRELFSSTLLEDQLERRRPHGESDLIFLLACAAIVTESCCAGRQEQVAMVESWLSSYTALLRRASYTIDEKQALAALKEPGVRPLTRLYRGGRVDGLYLAKQLSPARLRRLESFSASARRLGRRLLRVRERVAASRLYLDFVGRHLLHGVFISDGIAKEREWFLTHILLETLKRRS